MQFSFTAELIEWRGPSPYYFLVMPTDIGPAIAVAAQVVSYGWGVVPVKGRIGGTAFTTSLIPRDGSFYVPIKNVVRIGEGLTLGQVVAITITLGSSR